VFLHRGTLRLCVLLRLGTLLGLGPGRGDLMFLRGGALLGLRMLRLSFVRRGGMLFGCGGALLGGRGSGLTYSCPFM
jgi:hypothetical protein